MSITFETARLNGLPGVETTTLDFDPPQDAGSWGITIRQEGALAVVMARSTPDGKDVTGNITVETATSLIEDAIATLKTRGAKAHRTEIDRLRVAVSDVALYGAEGTAVHSNDSTSAHPDATPQTDSAPLIERSHNIMFLTINTLAREGMELARVTHLSHYGAGFRLHMEQAGAEIFITHAGAKMRLSCVETPIGPHEAKQILEDLRMALRKRREEHPEALALVDSAVRGWVTDVTHEVSADPELKIVTDGPHGAIKKLTARIVGHDFTSLTIAGHQSYTAYDQHGDEIAEPLAGQALQWLITYHTNAGRLSAALRQAIEDLYGVLAEQWAALNPDDPEDDDLDDEAAALELDAEDLGQLADEAGKDSRFGQDLASHGILADLTERAIGEFMESMNSPMAPSSRRLPLQWLTLDPRCQPREGIDEETVARYEQLLRDGVSLPAISVIGNPCGPERWVVDGWHRVAAHKRAGSVTIEAEIVPGSHREAVWAACAANATHGLTRSRADLHRAINIILDDPEWAALPNREIGRHLGCDGKTISAARKRRAPAELPQEHDQETDDLTIMRESEADQVVVEEGKQALADGDDIAEAAPVRCAYTTDLEQMIDESKAAKAAERKRSIDRALKRLRALLEQGWQLHEVDGEVRLAPQES